MPTGFEGDDDELLGTLGEAASAANAALVEFDEWRVQGDRSGQYRLDLVADAAVVAVLDAAGLGVVSEESGATSIDRSVVVVADPIDGSTNASRRIPFFATSLAAVDRDGVRAALVVDQVSGTRWSAVRGEGARCNGVTMRANVGAFDGPIVAVNGVPPSGGPWAQFRSLGCASLELVGVAAGWFDGYVNLDGDSHGPWDYLAGMLIVRESGGVVADRTGRDLVTIDHGARRSIVAARSVDLFDALVEVAPGGGVT